MKITTIIKIKGGKIISKEKSEAVKKAEDLKKRLDKEQAEKTALTLKAIKNAVNEKGKINPGQN
jgi:hypothetical protein